MVYVRIAKLVGCCVVAVASLGLVPAPAQASHTGSWPWTDTGYRDCSASNRAVDYLGVRLRHPVYGNRSVWSAVPTYTARYYSVSDSLTGTELWGCTYWVYNYNVLSYQSLIDQFDCHDMSPGGVGTGPTWDLEGSRPATRNYYTWVKTRCGW